MARPEIAVLGGTFDPPHIGHLVLAECVRVQFGASKVLFVPAGEPYRKAHRGVTSTADRVAMTALAIHGEAEFVLDEREVRRAGPSYTVETLEELRAEGHERPLLVLGDDALADMAHWRAPARIVELARVVVAVRPGEHDRARGDSKFERVDMPQLLISSSELRARVAEGKSIRYLVPDAVEKYIRDRRLYRGEATAPGEGVPDQRRG